MIRFSRLAAAAMTGLLLAGCQPEPTAPRPDPVSMTDNALGFYCQMNLKEHPGPKAQVHLEGLTGMPLFFAQVRDAIAYQRMPEQESPILAVYVSDMDKAKSWEEPGPDNWIAADAAFYVAGADVGGGMGAPEFVPFGTEAGAEDFAKQHGGHVVRLDGIANEDVLAPVDFKTDADGNFLPPETTLSK